MSKYPEHEKLHAVHDKSQVIGEFLDSQGVFNRMIWMDRYEKEDVYAYFPCEDESRVVDPGYVNPEGWVLDHRPIEKVLAEYFDIDLDRLEAEKRQILDEFRAKSA